MKKNINAAKNHKNSQKGTLPLWFFVETLNVRASFVTIGGTGVAFAQKQNEKSGGLTWELDYNNDYKPIIDHSWPKYQYDLAYAVHYPLARKYVDVWESVKHGEFVVDDLARAAMVFAYLSSTNAP